MADKIKPIRLVVTGNDASGKSWVLYDSAAPIAISSHDVAL